MKTNILITNFVLILTLTMTSLSHSADPTPIIDNVIDYATTISPVDRGGFSYPMALIGGHITTELAKPLNVTLRIGGQTYTALTDSAGVYSFMAYTNGARNYQIEVWTNNRQLKKDIHSLKFEK